MRRYRSREQRPKTTPRKSRRRRILPDAALRSILKRIGQPHPTPFRPDPFQLKGLQLTEEYDTLVSAPTGAGKTWIAQEVIGRRLGRGMRSWYASPLKALSNAKYEEFGRRFGRGSVGILTGDRKENAEAPVLVGTTEILRNQLYDAMERGEDLDVDLVVMDEAHYLNDPERGVVWEEVLIYLPSRVRLLMLSATVGNLKQLKAWLERIRQKACHLVVEDQRPVPLFPVFLHSDGRLGLLMDDGKLTASVRRYLKEKRHGGRLGLGPIWELHEVVDGLRPLNLLPAIFFLKSRADCDRAVDSVIRHLRPVGDRAQMEDAVRPFLESHPLLGMHRQFQSLLSHRAASHHAGQLPQWKLFVEQLMNAGQLDVIFATSTVAAGVDFPARTVVLVQSDRYDGRQFIELTATELQQMTGRAGRRGKDQVGFAVFVPGPHQDIHRIARLLRAKPDPIRSQIHINFSMVLNLLLSHPPEGVRHLLGQSLAAFQQDRESRTPRLPKRRGTDLRPRSLLAGRVGRGRLFVHRDGAVYVAVGMRERRGRPVCMAHRIDRKVRVRKGKLVLKGIPLDQIEAVLDRSVTLSEGDLEKTRRTLEQLDVDEILERITYESTPPDEHGFAGEASHEEAHLWQDFVRHLHFLRDTGFADDRDRLTADGRWASRLRLDHPILVAEAIRQGVFQNRSAAVLAGLMAPFVTDREREVFILDRDLKEMGDAFDDLIGGIFGILKLMRRWEFPTPILQFWPSACLYCWAKELVWSELCRVVPLDEGDLVALIVRTADQLRQICDLSETHPRLVRTARSALQRIQREPAVYA